MVKNNNCKNAKTQIIRQAHKEKTITPYQPLISGSETSKLTCAEQIGKTILKAI